MYPIPYLTAWKPYPSQHYFLKYVLYSLYMVVPSGRSRPSDKVGAGHPDPEIRGGLQKKIFWPFGPHFGQKIRSWGGPAPPPGPLPWIRQWYHSPQDTLLLLINPFWTKGWYCTSPLRWLQVWHEFTQNKLTASHYYVRRETTLEATVGKIK